jgi:hypothetical protein
MTYQRAAYPLVVQSTIENQSVGERCPAFVRSRALSCWDLEDELPRF